MIPDPITRFIRVKDVVTHFKVLKTAAEECDEYEWMRAGENAYICQHGEQIYPLLLRNVDGNLEIACGCPSWQFAKGDDGCKHAAAYLKRSKPPQKPITDAIARDLMASGWTGGKGNLQPPKMTSDEEGEDCEGNDPTPTEPPKRDPVAPPGLGEKMYSRSCPHCDLRIEGTDLDDVKRRHREHIASCPKRSKGNDTTQKPPQKAQQEQKPEQTQEVEENMTAETQTAVQTTEPQRGFLTAAVSLDDAIAAFDLYGQAKTRLLNDTDVLYIGAAGKPVHKDVKDAMPYIKKSGWRKMARFFGLSIDIIGKEKIWTEDAKSEKYYIWAYQIKVSHQCGAYVLSEGVCSSRDKFFTKGGKVQADETNVMLKAQTVGINRGISDLLGAGEVSAEEME